MLAVVWGFKKFRFLYTGKRCFLHRPPSSRTADQTEQNVTSKT